MDALTKGQLQEDPLMLQFQTQKEREELDMLMHWILGFIFCYDFCLFCSASWTVRGTRKASGCT